MLLDTFDLANALLERGLEPALRQDMESLLLDADRGWGFVERQERKAFDLLPR